MKYIFWNKKQCNLVVAFGTSGKTNLAKQAKAKHKEI